LDSVSLAYADRLLAAGLAATGGDVGQARLASPFAAATANQSASTGSVYTGLLQSLASVDPQALKQTVETIGRVGSLTIAGTSLVGSIFVGPELLVAGEEAAALWTQGTLVLGTSAIATIEAAAQAVKNGQPAASAFTQATEFVAGELADLALQKSLSGLYGQVFSDSATSTLSKVMTIAGPEASLEAKHLVFDENAPNQEGPIAAAIDNNLATIQGNLSSQGGGGNSGGATADIAVSLSGPPSIAPGQDAVYTVTVTNNGPQGATQVPVHFSLDSSNVAAIASDRASQGTAQSDGLLNVDWQAGDLNAGASATLTVDVQTISNPIGDMPATVNVFPGELRQADPNDANNTATVDTRFGS
ncbi:MAG: DUF11 domain-containing protein, partial [Candidatus Saccharimonadales bacterium]